MQILAHYRRGFLLRRVLVTAALAALWVLMAWLCLNPPDRDWVQEFSSVSMLLVVTGWLWWNLLIAWAGLVQRRPLLWVQGGELVVAHRRIQSIPLGEVRRVAILLAGPQGRMVIEGAERRIKVSQWWAHEDIEAIAAAVREAIRSDDWIASAPTIQPAAPTPVG